MKKFLIALVLIISFTANAHEIDSAWVVNNYTKKEVYIPMRDGIKLFTAIYLPKDNAEKHPFLVKRTPYSCAPYGENNFVPFWKSYEKVYLQQGYIMVFQDVRGRWMSEDEFVNVRPFNPDKKGKDIDEASDTYDTIDWLLKNIEHNNGNAGVHGISYPGFYSTMAAASNHPALKAVSPQAPVTNWFIGDDFHHNGAFFQMDAFSFYSPLGFGFGQPHIAPTKIPARSVGFPDHDNYNFYLETGTLKNLSRYNADTIAFWNELMSHPNYDDFWKARDARNATHNLKPAMLWVGGLFDAEDTWGAWSSYKAAEKNNPGKEFNRIVNGPWYHGQWASNDGSHLGNIYFESNTSTYFQRELEVPFFQYYLKNEGSVSNIAEATIFITGENNWKKFSTWPPAVIEKTIYLNPDGNLSENKNTSENNYSEYTSDPSKPVPYEEDVHFNRTRKYMTADQRFAAKRPDVLVFKSDTLTKDITVTGEIIADLQTSISTTDADFVVKVIDVFPNNFTYNDVDIYAECDPAPLYPMSGYQMLVRGEIFRGKYRKSFEQPEAFEPGKIETIKFALPDIAHTFKKGHRLMIQIQSSWFPLADRNPQQFLDIYKANKEDFIKSDIRIYHDNKHASKIILPILQ